MSSCSWCGLRVWIGVPAPATHGRNARPPRALLRRAPAAPQPLAAFVEALRPQGERAMASAAASAPRQPLLHAIPPGDDGLPCHLRGHELCALCSYAMAHRLPDGRRLLVRVRRASARRRPSGITGRGAAAVRRRGGCDAKAVPVRPGCHACRPMPGAGALPC